MKIVFSTSGDIKEQIVELTFHIEKSAFVVDKVHRFYVRSSCPFELRDLEEANKALAKGLSVRRAAEVLAARKLARSHGRQAATLAALAGLRGMGVAQKLPIVAMQQ